MTSTNLPDEKKITKKQLANLKDCHLANSDIPTDIEQWESNAMEGLDDAFELYLGSVQQLARS